MDELSKIIRLLKNSSLSVQVGIFAGSARSGMRQNASGSFSQETINNASVGAVHEFGTAHIPKRSFLQMPIEERLQNSLKKFLSEGDLKESIKAGSFVPLAQKIGEAALATVEGAFDSEGYGHWAPHAKPVGHSLLVDTEQLRNSLSFKVRG